ncbi:MAG: hypothetical protein BA870_07230 [Desulfuromonadales bacterium C00003094]|nr:MAG: hypothetical protein BA870_07230 [Desulfuromonadales bacterium C00003094]
MTQTATTTATATVDTTATEVTTVVSTPVDSIDSTEPATEQTAAPDAGNETTPLKLKTDKSTPGFAATFAIAGLLAIACLMMRRKR